LGYVYLDLFQRSGKFTGGANFPIKFPSSHAKFARVALVCNFPPSSSWPVLLPHTCVEELFHEFGHLLNTILSRPDLQHFAGTRQKLDFVETASTFFQHYSWDYRVLKLFAKHYKTGEVLPEKAIQNLHTLKNIFSGLTAQHQIILAVLDQVMHSGKQEKSSTEIFGDLHNKYSTMPFVKGLSCYATCSHFVGYGAAYYSYFYSEVLSSNIWHKIFKKILSLEKQVRPLEEKF